MVDPLERPGPGEIAPRLTVTCCVSATIALTARPAADGMITSSHRRPLAHLPADGPDAAEHDIRRLLRWPHYMWRLFRLARRTPALVPGGTIHR
jgi:hypothetical protein